MKSRLLVLIGLVLGATSASAHHSFSSEFDENAPIKSSDLLQQLDELKLDSRMDAQRSQMIRFGCH